VNKQLRVRTAWLAAACVLLISGTSRAGDPPVLSSALHTDTTVPATKGEPTLETFRDAARGRAAGGDNQTALTGRALPAPLVVVATGPDGKPLVGALVQFRLVAPQDHALGEATTGTDGRAAFNFATGESPAPYTVLARLHGEAGIGAETVFHLQVRRPAWAMFLLFGLFGGMGLFLYGMTIMSNALQRSAGRRLRTILSAVTANRFIGLAVGAFVTMLIQSSSATTVMLVSFVQAGLISFSQTLGVILGADIGTTITVQLIAFNLTDYALLVVAIGFTMRVLPRGGRLVSIGEILLGCGILFFGMQVMSDAMHPLRSYQPFLDQVLRLENPILSILLGTAFSAAIHSSAAFIGIVMVLAQQGLLSLEAAIPLLLGANVGTCITAVMASLGTSRPARRVAAAHTGFKILGVLLLVGWIPTFAALVRSISPGHGNLATDPETMARLLPRQIANAHTIFNVALAVICLPFTGVAARLVTRLLPDKPESEKEWTLRARHLDQDMVRVPALALNLAKVEILSVGDRVRSMAQDCLKPFVDHDPALLADLHRREEEVDALEEQITAYLVEIGRQKLSGEQLREVYLMLHVVKQFEHIADVVDKQITPLALKMIDRGSEFSASGREEVATYHVKMCKQMSRALDTFLENSLEKAQHMRSKQANYLALEDAYRQSHFERVHDAVAESVATSEIHLELMDCFRQMSSASTNIGRAIMTMNSGGMVPDLDD
jgi:phosphate:Na+ symporter